MLKYSQNQEFTGVFKGIGEGFLVNAILKKVDKFNPLPHQN